MDFFQRIAELRIREAMEAGAFDHLEGTGRPLDFSEDGRVPRELRTIYRIMKNANVLPPELALRRDIRGLEDLLPRIEEEGELRGAVRHINEKITALNTLTGRSRRQTVGNEMAQLYADKLIERLRARAS